MLSWGRQKHRVQLLDRKGLARHLIRGQ
jgi:hypothetical protein